MTSPATGFSALRSSLQGISGSAAPTQSPQSPAPALPPVPTPPPQSQPTSQFQPQPQQPPLDPLSVSEPTVVPTPPPVVTVDPPVLPAAPADISQTLPSPDPAALSPDPVSLAPTAASAPAPDADPNSKSPLEVLEEILAGAEAEKSQKDDEAAQKAQEEAEFQAQLKAKQDAFASQAVQRLEEQKVNLEEATQRREVVEQELVEQGKQDPSTPNVPAPFQIRQLVHETPETP